MNPSILHFSRSGNALKALFFVAVAVFAFAVAGLLHRDSTAVPPSVRFDGPVPPPPAPRSDPLAPVKIPALIVAGCVCLFLAGRHGTRMVARRVAVRIEGGRLHCHASLMAAPGEIPIDAIIDAQFDRADRVPGDGVGTGAAAARFGARMRHVLHLRYTTDGSVAELRLVDNDVDGGVDQLRRFAAHLDAWRQSAARLAERG